MRPKEICRICLTLLKCIQEIEARVTAKTVGVPNKVARD